MDYHITGSSGEWFQSIPPQLRATYHYTSELIIELELFHGRNTMKQCHVWTWQTVHGQLIHSPVLMALEMKWQRTIVSVGQKPWTNLLHRWKINSQSPNKDMNWCTYLVNPQDKCFHSIPRYQKYKPFSGDVFIIIYLFKDSLCVKIVHDNTHTQRNCSAHEMDLREPQWITTRFCEDTVWSMVYFTFMPAIWKHTAPFCCRPCFETVDLG